MKKKEEEREEESDFNAEKSCLLSAQTRAYAGSYKFVQPLWQMYIVYKSLSTRFVETQRSKCHQMSMKVPSLRRRVPIRETIDAIPFAWIIFPPAREFSLILLVAFKSRNTLSLDRCQIFIYLFMYFFKIWRADALTRRRKKILTSPKEFTKCK